jgi:transposase IS66 family protein
VDRNVDDEFELDRLHDSLPLYRQAQIYARQGVALDRSTLADWVEHAAFHLRPLHERLLTVLGARSKLFADETTVPVLDPGRGRTKTGQLWAYAADDRPWGGLDPPGPAPIASEALNPSPHSMRSRRRSAAAAPRNVASCGSRRAGRG